MKKLVFTFGRMNPPTIGHEKLANKIKEVARKQNATPRIYLSHSQNPKKDPLSYNDKYRFATKAFGIVKRSQSKQIFQILPEIEKEGFTEITMVVGSDRINEFDRVLKKYNGKDYNFNSIKTVSSGDRDPDAQGVEGMSGSKLRQTAKDGDEKTFKSGLASKLSDADKKSIYNKVRKNLKEADMEWTEEDDIILEQVLQELELTEQEEDDFAELGELYELNEVLNFQQRLKKSRLFRRLAPKIARMRKIAAKKMKSPAKLLKLAQKAAIKLIRKKVAGKKGANYANLSPADKMNVDRKVQSKKSMISKIAKRLLPKVRKQSMDRVAQARKGPQNAEYVPEELDERKGTPRVHAKTFSNLNLKKARELMSPAKHREDGIQRIMKGMNVSKVKATKYHDDVMKSYGFKPESIEEKYDLYHKDFSGAMQHAYAYAKKKFGMTVDKGEIDDKVATGPRKPGVGKTNRYSLKTNKGMLQIQVYNKGGAKPYELNMYKEDKSVVPQDRDVKDEPGSQPKTYYKGVAKDKKDDRYRAFKRGSDKHHDDPSAYPDSHPGDKDAKTKPSKHTKKYRDMFGESLWANIHKKRKEGRPMRKPGSKGAPTDQDFKNARGESSEIGEAIPKSTMYALVQKGKVVAKGSKSDMMSKKKKEGGTVYNAPSKKVGDVIKETYVVEDAGAALKKKSEKSGIPVGILRKVYNRGMAAWRTGHRPGATQQQWGMARVNSFITKGSGTWGKADKDLAAKARGSKKESIEEKTYMRTDSKLKNLKVPVKRKNRNDTLAKKIKAHGDKKEDVNLMRKAEQSGIDIDIIKEVYNRGYASWEYDKPRCTPEQWAFARVNSFITRTGATWNEHDYDLAEKVEKRGPLEIGTDKINATYRKDTPGQTDEKPKLMRVLSQREIKAAHCEDYNVDDDFSGKIKKRFRDFIKESEDEGCPVDLFDHVLEEAEYQGKKVTLNNPTRSSDGKKKFYVYVKNEKGNVIKLGFGDPNMEIKRDDPARRKSFRARHNCDNPGPKYKARYWSCYQWRAGSKVDN